MTNFEMVEQLRAKANVSYEEARDALEKSNWDLLDAMVLLEKEGKVAAESAGSYSTKAEPEPEKNDPSRFAETISRVGRRLAKLIQHGNDNFLEISRKGDVILTLPVTVLLLLLIFLCWITLPLLIVGLFTGFRYAFRGPDLGREGLNKAMGKASDMAENVKSEIKTDAEKNK